MNFVYENCPGLQKPRRYNIWVTIFGGDGGAKKVYQKMVQYF